jgi:hypothetical protein
MGEGRLSVMPACAETVNKGKKKAPFCKRKRLKIVFITHGGLLRGRDDSTP